MLNQQGHDLRELKQIYTLIKPHIIETPLLECRYLSKLIKGRALVKAESLQVTGAFKFRGALYRLMSLTENQQENGVAAYSSGNFAAGLAAAGKLLNISVSLVMPQDAPEKKIHNARQYGADVILCDHSYPSREEAAANMATELALKHRMTLLHPFDDLLLIKGQSSVAIELLKQLEKLKTNCDELLCPVGGGSLVAGSSLVFNSPCQVWAIEAESYNGMGLSLNAGCIQRAPGKLDSDCDALMALEPGNENCKLAIKNNVSALSVGKDAIHKAIQLAHNELNLVLEPSGAIGLAALMNNPDLFKNKTVVVIATGGNVDMKKYVSLLNMP